LARHRGQHSLGGWLAGTRVCRIDGKAAGTLRVLALDFAQGLTDVACVLAVCVVLACYLTDGPAQWPTKAIIIFASMPSALLVVLACMAQHTIASECAVQFGERSLPEVMTGTVLRVHRPKSRLE